MGQGLLVSISELCYESNSDILTCIKCHAEFPFESDSSQDFFLMASWEMSPFSTAPGLLI